MTRARDGGAAASFVPWRAWRGDGDTWAAWVHFAPTNPAKRWPAIIVDRALRCGGLYALHVILNRLYGCGFIRDDAGRATFVGPA